MKKIFFFKLVLLFLPGSRIFAQQITADSLQAPKTLDKNFSYRPGRLWVPCLVIGSGAAISAVKPLRGINTGIKEDIWNERPHRSTHADNFLPYLPVASVIVLNIAGVKGTNSLRDLSVVYLISNIYMNVAVQSVKRLSHEERPDLSDHLSFPSGHTAQAFVCAELLRIEYRERSAWFGIGGYAAATATGYLRMYNNKHWFSDVVAGAGVGILSTRLAYWTYSKLKPHIFKKNKAGHSFLLPAYENGALGFCYLRVF